MVVRDCCDVQKYDALSPLFKVLLEIYVAEQITRKELGDRLHTLIRDSVTIEKAVDILMDFAMVKKVTVAKDGCCEFYYEKADVTGCDMANNLLLEIGYSENVVDAPATDRYATMKARVVTRLESLRANFSDANAQKAQAAMRKTRTELDRDLAMMGRGSRETVIEPYFI